ncbi:hypothetical protein EZI54_09000 [Marinobacter halodurans]|uniref:Uncharacterized protein n=1 Tax=Marinobacter halodurans TaxID=2528979 RepID=A0ABY1ZL14_9GAMM|nr:hypothetical protein [Marinobacter halodurans]TBW56427.1 hypothetical protein EZI54_09000 [Marinobacter halodurans]
MSDTQPPRSTGLWWRGVADLASAGAEVTARRLEGVHLSIADETFDVLARIPVTRPFSEPVRRVHHGIAALSYRCVALGARGLNQWVRSPAPDETGANEE